MCVEISRATRRAGRLTELNRLEVICVLLGWPGIFHFCMCARSHQHHGAVCTESTIVLCAFSVAIKIVTLVIYAGVTCAAAVMCSLGHCVRNCGNMTSEVKKREEEAEKESFSVLRLFRGQCVREAAENRRQVTLCDVTLWEKERDRRVRGDAGASLGFSANQR